MQHILLLRDVEQQAKDWLGVPVECYFGTPNPEVASVALRIIRATAQPLTGWTVAVANLSLEQSLPADAFAPLIVQAFLKPGQAQSFDATPLLTGRVGLEEIRKTLTEIFS